MKRETEGELCSTDRVVLPEKVAHFYYTHGLLCSSHPILVLSFAISIIFLCSYSLINFPLPGDIPVQAVTNSHNVTVPDNFTLFSGKPAVYVQQIVLKTGVSPWVEGLTVCDAFRAPLYQIFPLLEVVRNFHLENSSLSLSNLCLHVEAVKLKSSEDKKKLFPEYSCLVVSPANFWQQNENKFQMDTNLMGTIFNYHNIQKGKISLTEILFGVSMKESGLKRHPLRSRSRILQYAITIILEEYDEQYISGLRNKLEHQFSLSGSAGHVFNASKIQKQSNEALHVFYPGEFSFRKLLPLATFHVLLFLYIYFSLRKMEQVKSKLGIAFSAAISIFSCLCMSIGLCFFFGLTVSLDGKEPFPYFVVIVGLENILVITKSIMNTPSHLDAKIRVAQGLSHEGWSITKNLLVQVTILTIGFSTFISAIQELCILGIVGLVCDFFLQLFFFTTILSIDIHRTECNLDNKRNQYYHFVPVQKVFTYNKFESPLYERPNLRHCGQQAKTLMRSKSHTNLASRGGVSSASHSTDVLGQSPHTSDKTPKRLKLVNLWASTRFFQRAFMIALIMWMCFILYTDKFMQQVWEIDEIAKFHEKLQIPVRATYKSNSRKSGTGPVAENANDLKSFSAFMSEESSSNKNDADHIENGDIDLSRFRHRDQDSHRRLSLYHWPVMMSLYNISLTGKYITILPSIRISQTVSPESAIAMRNPEDKMAKFQWKSLAVALDPLDFSTSDGEKSSSLLSENTDSPFIPRSPMEIALSFILVVVSVFVLAYMTMVLYRCICSRNYAEWRSSWSSNSQQEKNTQVVLEAVSIPLEGHSQQIECLISDGIYIVSSCLGGEIRVWNSSDGELVAQIDRPKYFFSLRNAKDGDSCTEQSGFSNPESKLPRSAEDVDFQAAILNGKGVRSRKKVKSKLVLKPIYNFSELKPNAGKSDEQNVNKGFDFETPYEMLTKEESGSSVEDFDSVEHFSSLFNEGFGNPDSHEPNSSNGDNWRCSVDSSFVPESLTSEECGRAPPVWCLDLLDNLVAVGCSSGRVEFWECSSSKLRCAYEDGSRIGVTGIKLYDDKVIVARLNGSLDLLQVEIQSRRQSDWGFTSTRRTHVRTGSAGSSLNWEKYSDEIGCRKVNAMKAHQQPITVLDCEKGRIVTGSQDHTLKVIRLEDFSLQYTLHSHCGPITCMFIDKDTPFLSGSGSHDGVLCFWDLLTGACLYSIPAHDGSITALTYSASYVISLGTDERICVWERFLGHLLNTIQVMHAFCSSMVMITRNLLVTSKQGSLVMWDVRTGEPVRIVRLGNSDFSVFVKEILNLGDRVVCDYGSQLRIVRFPIITDKTD